MDTKNKILERLVKRIVEDRNKKVLPGEDWFYENPCILKQFPKVKLDGAAAQYEASNRLWTMEQNGLLVITVKPENSGDNKDAYKYRYGRWWCDPVTKKFQWETNPDGKPVVPTKNTNTYSSIPQAKTMDDVKNKKGYIIKGMRGPVVKELQQMLIKLGYDLGPSKDDSIFGDKTFNSIVDFQKKASIKPKNNQFGVFGSITLGEMNKKLTQK